ncbi:MAG: glycosyltransferase family 2 protein [Alphaproteobacteria bacterium]|nr:glycosyltransferase family 2 protein [Alphaproteobacteria bacterium]
MTGLRLPSRSGPEGTKPAARGGDGATVVQHAPRGGRPAAASASGLPIGSFDAVVDGRLVTGWAWSEADRNRPCRIAIQIDGDQITTIEPQGFRADLAAAGIGHGCYAFQWRVPDALLDGAEKEIRIVHLDAGMELPGSPRKVSLAVPEARTAVVPSLFVNGNLTLWPGGLVGAVAAGQAEIAPGLWVQSADAARALSFTADGPRSGGAGESTYFGVRVEADAPVRMTVLHRIADSAGLLLKGGAELTIEVSLGEADEPFIHRPVEIALVKQGKDGFERVRRIARGRAHRLPGLIPFRIELNGEEEALLRARVLFLGVQVDRARTIRLMPARMSAPVVPPAQGFIGFEDRRLEGTIEACRQLAAAAGRAEQFDRLWGAAAATGDGVAAQAPVGTTEGAAYPFVQIIVPVFNGDAAVRECLQSVVRATTTPFQVLVVNDGSRAHTTRLLREFAATDPRIAVFDRTVNRGYTKSINEAVKLTAAEWVVVLNSDTIVSHGWLARLLDAARSRPDVGMAGPLSNAASWQSIPRVKDADGGWTSNPFVAPADTERVQSALERVSERAYPEVPLLNGFCTLIARTVFERCGIYDEDAFPIGYGEETDLCLRAAKAGFKLVVADDCFVYHRKSLSFGGKQRRTLSRAGNQEIANKHLGLSIPQLEERLQRNAVLARLRERLAGLERELR